MKLTPQATNNLPFIIQNYEDGLYNIDEVCYLILSQFVRDGIDSELLK